MAGLSIALREAVRLIQGAGNNWLPSIRRGYFVLFEGGGFGVYLADSQIAILVLAVLTTAPLAYLVMHTRWGRAHRACADDPKMAGLLGVDIWSTLNRSFTIGTVLAAIAGTAFTLQYGEADFFMGYFMGFKALTAALLGGFGTVTGALIGGLPPRPLRGAVCRLFQQRLQGRRHLRRARPGAHLPPERLAGARHRQQQRLSRRRQLRQTRAMRIG